MSQTDSVNSENTTERSHSLWRFLKMPFLYEAFQKSIAKKGCADFIIDELWKIQPQMTVVDVGWGPENLRHIFPDSITYYGFDPSEDYIKQAQESFPDDTFHVGTMDSFFAEFGSDLEGNVDVVTCSGVLHHVPQVEMENILEKSMQILKPESGRFAAIEPTYLQKQDSLSRWVLGKDRGTSILYDYQWRELFDKFSPNVTCRVVNSCCGFRIHTSS